MNGIMTRRERQKVGCYAPYSAKPLDSPLTQLVQLNGDDFDSVSTFVTKSDFFGQERSLYINRGAKWQELTTLEW